MTSSECLELSGYNLRSAEILVIKGVHDFNFWFSNGLPKGKNSVEYIDFKVLTCRLCIGIYKAWEY